MCCVFGGGWWGIKWGGGCNGGWEVGEKKVGREEGEKEVVS